jgi:protein-S-isoprenylcysteine O-methyltransferase Ste14
VLLPRLSAAQNLGWIVCVVYSTIPSFWLIIHPKAEYWRSRRRSPYRILLPYWIALWIAVGAVTWPWRRFELYRTTWTWVPAAALIGVGLWIYKYASQDFTAAQLGGVPEVQRGARSQRLVTAGIRSRVRHPVYMAHLCELIAWSIGSGLLVCYVLTAFAIVTGAIMIRTEDAELENRFGDEYRAYRDAVAAIVPSRSIYNPDKPKAG